MLPEAERHIAHLEARIDSLERDIRDLQFRFDTLQTPWWKRLWFAVDGWPWYNLNARTRQWRPWHRTKLNPKGWVE